MKRRILFMLFCITVILLPMNAKKKCEMRVASYNLRLDTPNDLENAWPNRKEMVKSLVLFHDFDIFGTQEGFKHQLDGILETGVYKYVGHGRDDGQDAGEHSAILYKPAKYKLLESGDFWYSETPEVPGKGWDAVCCNRICSWAKFKDIKSGKQFYFFNSHFDHQGQKARLESSKLLISKIKQLAGGLPVISTGDFNAVPDSEPVKTILNDGLLKDSYSLSELTPYGPAGTFQSFKMDAPLENRIDYIFVTDKIRILKYGVLTDFFKGRFPSDHCPVVADLEF
jgi:endonuclease/exonuclease/phosphatase family metal-dependent hydrolase